MYISFSSSVRIKCFVFNSVSTKIRAIVVKSICRRFPQGEWKSSISYIFNLYYASFPRGHLYYLPYSIALSAVAADTFIGTDRHFAVVFTQWATSWNTSVSIRKTNSAETRSFTSKKFIKGNNEQCLTAVTIIIVLSTLL